MLGLRALGTLSPPTCMNFLLLFYVITQKAGLGSAGRVLAPRERLVLCRPSNLYNRLMVYSQAT
jgi:hypothetical protein